MADLPPVATLELILDDGWLTIWFDRPQARNALTAEMTTELLAVLDRVRSDRAVRGITLRGRGGVFCAGGDLKAFARHLGGGGSRDDVVAMSRGVADLLHRVDTAPQVVVALVEGAAMAGGLGLLCCADVVICQSEARFALTETRLGLSPAQIAPYVVRRVGHATARRLMLTAARFRGTDALAMGLADFVADDVAGLEAIEARVRADVLACAPEAIAATKALIGMLPTSRESSVAAGAETFADRLLSDEAREGIAAFVGKRRASWAPESD